MELAEMLVLQYHRDRYGFGVSTVQQYSIILMWKDYPIRIKDIWHTPKKRNT